MVKFWNGIPDFIRVGIWVGFSALVTYVGAEVLNRPELAAYYGVVNVALYSIKELDKKVRRNGKK